jgi:hypothetical protein
MAILANGYDTGVQILTQAERDRLVRLIDIQNTATQVDRDENDELHALLDKLFERGEW